MPELGNRFVIRAWYRRGPMAQVPSEGAESGRSGVHSSLESRIAASRFIDETDDLPEAIKGVAHQDTVISCLKGFHNQYREVGDVGQGTHFQVVAQNDW